MPCVVWSLIPTLGLESGLGRLKALFPQDVLPSFLSGSFGRSGLRKDGLVRCSTKCPPLSESLQCAACLAYMSLASRNALAFRGPPNCLDRKWRMLG